MIKRRIIHVIDNLVRGGAETMLVDLLPDLSIKYDIILVTLDNKSDFKPEQIHCKERICLQYKGIKDILPASLRLKKIIKHYQPDLVRSQLFWSTIITRLSCPKKIPLFFSVHATLDFEENPIAFYKRSFLKLLETITYNKKQNMIGVTQAVIDSFTKIHPNHGGTFLLHNYVRNIFFQEAYQNDYNRNRVLRMVAVNNIRLIKNIPYLIEVMNTLPKDKIMLDIYGDGPLWNIVNETIEKYQLKNVRLMGKRTDIYAILPNYDLFISSSVVEGFGIAVAEAMSVGLPVIISDIPVYREICRDNAIYFDNKDPNSLRRILLSVIEGEIDIGSLSKNNREYAMENFMKQGYLNKLDKIYNEGFNNYNCI